MMTVPDGLPLRQRIPAIVVVLLCVAMSSISITLVNLALPIIASEFQVGADKVIYVVSGYQLTLVLFLLVLSNLGDFFGFKQMFLTGTALFVAASVGCTVSPSLPVLIVFRVIQGLGATAIQGSYFSLMALIYPRRQLGRGIGLGTMTFALATLAGPPLAAFILSAASWHWLFLLNVPFGVLSLLLGWRYLPANVVRVSKCPINIGDVTLHVTVFGLFFFAAAGWSHQPQQWIGNLALSVLCVANAFLYVHRQRGKERPFLPIDLLRQSSFGFPIVLSILGFAALLSVVVAVPFIFQSRFGYSAAHTGFLLTAMTGATVLSSLIAGYAMEKVKPICLCGFGFMTMALGAFSLAVCPGEVTASDLLWRLGLFGFGSGLVQPANNFMAISSAPADRKGAANGALATSMMFGQNLGMVFVSAAFSLTGNEAALFPFYLSGTIAIAGCGVVIFRLRGMRDHSSINTLP